MNDIVNKITGCFKMNVDLNGLHELEKYITNLEKENQQLKENIRYLQGLITNKIMVSEGYESVLKEKFNELELQYISSQNCCNELESQLKQRDEVIDEISKLIEEYGICEEMVKMCSIYDVNGIEIYKILQKYKGDNNDNR